MCARVKVVWMKECKHECDFVSVVQGWVWMRECKCARVEGVNVNVSVTERLSERVSAIAVVFS